MFFSKELVPKHSEILLKGNLFLQRYIRNHCKAFAYLHAHKGLMKSEGNLICNYNFSGDDQTEEFFSYILK